MYILFFLFFCQAEDGIRDSSVTGVQTCALPICPRSTTRSRSSTISPESIANRYGHEGRSEERRERKECRSRWSPYHEKNKRKNMNIKLRLALKCRAANVNILKRILG